MANNTFFDTSELNYTYTNVDNSIVDDTDLKPEHLGVMLLIYRYKHMSDCSLSIKFLADKCACSRDRMTKICNELEKHGYLERDVFRDKKGQTATIFRVHPDPKKLGKKYEKAQDEPATPEAPEAPEPDKQKAGEQLTLEDAPVKEVSASKAKAAKTKELEAEFEELWGLYPRKRGDKDRARKSYVAERKAGTTREQVEAGIKAYKAEVADTDTKFIVYGSKWFCEKRWHDYDEMGTATTGGDADTEAVVAEIYKTVPASNYVALSAQAKALITEAQFEALQTIEAEAYVNEDAKYKKKIRSMITGA